jgi:hypothetical protein
MALSFCAVSLELKCVDIFALEKMVPIAIP